MAASTSDIRRWFIEGKKDGATHMIVVCDSFDWSNYPVYVKAGENPREIASGYNGKDMQKVMEVYNLSMDMDKQLNSKTMVMNYD